MIILVIFAFLAGLVTVLSPCILPILPIILTSSIGGIDAGKSRPVGVIAGFILSFTFFTLFLSTIVRFSGIPPETLRYISVVVVAVFGISLLVPGFQIIVERIFSRVAGLLPSNQGKSGFIGGLVIGLSVGLLWTPCVGPILASVISLAITGTVTFDAFVITLSYSLGTAIPMFLIMLGGQNALRRVPWLVSHTGHIQKFFGMIMILTAIGIFFNADRRFQTLVLNAFPQYGAGLTSFEDSEVIRNQLFKKSGNGIKKEEIGKPLFSMAVPKGPQAPEFIPGGTWFNSNPLTLAGLRGKVVIIDFWTYSCINCQRTMPYLRKWHEKYKDKGLVIIGVHAPEFEFEKNKQNVARAIVDFKLSYPIVQDNDFAIWRAYDNHYWPAKYFIDKDGYIRHTHFGEGEYDESEKVIQELLKEAGAPDVATEIHNPTYQIDAKTPETYVGMSRNPDKIGFTLAGDWNVMEEYASPQSGATLTLNFDAKNVYVVMRTKGIPAKIKVYLDDTMQFFGADYKNGIVTVDADRLYTLINLPVPGRHVLRLEFEDNNAEVFAFTFG